MHERKKERKDGESHKSVITLILKVGVERNFNFVQLLALSPLYKQIKILTFSQAATQKLANQQGMFLTSSLQTDFSVQCWISLVYMEKI